MLEDMKLITREEWIAALRSGKYKQATGSMKTYDGFCCLGVACDLAGMKWEDVKKPIQFDSSQIQGFLETVYGVEGREFGNKLIENLGILYDQNTLACKNDSGVSFTQIADILEGKQHA